MAKKELGVKLEIVQPKENELEVIGKTKTKVPNLVIEVKKNVKTKATKQTTTKKAPVKKATKTATKPASKTTTKKRTTKSNKDMEIEK